MSQVLVDDQDPRVVYTGSWEHDASTAEYGLTKSGASPAGLTASLNFSGIRIAVFGSQGSIDVDGQPSTTYAIDGVVVGTYTSPIIAPGYFTVNTVFFQSQTIPDGDHTLVITTTNGTRPNRYWLDYFQYTASPPASSSSSPSSSGDPSSTTTPSSSSAVVPVPSVSNASSSSRVEVGPIVGGVLGGIGIVIIAALLFLFYLRLRPVRTKELSPPPGTPPLSDVTPFPAWQQESRAPYTGAHKAMPSTSTQADNPLSSSSSPRFAPWVASPLDPSPQPNAYQPPGPAAPHMSASTDPTSGSGAEVISPLQREGRSPPADLRNVTPTSSKRAAILSPPPSSTPVSAEPIMRHHLDSGVRLPQAVVDVPPAYTQA